MQSVKFVMREVGEGAERVTAAEFEEYLQYQYLSDGYEIFNQHTDPIFEEKDFKGYRVFVTLTKNEEIKASKAK